MNIIPSADVGKPSGHVAWRDRCLTARSIAAHRVTDTGLTLADVQLVLCALDGEDVIAEAAG